MTLRDYIAVQAMMVYIRLHSLGQNRQIIAKWSYQMADFMLSEKRLQEKSLDA